jgi:hypothetical protein
MNFCNNIPNLNVGATLAVALRAVAPLAVALNPNTHKQGTNTTAQGDREGRPYGTDTIVPKSAIRTTVFVIIPNSIVETDNYPSLRNNNLTKGGYL